MSRQDTSNEYKQVQKERQKQELKRQEENPEISKKLIWEPRLIFQRFRIFLLLHFFRTL